MCEMCGRMGECHPQCPNADPMRTYGNCDNCNEPIPYGNPEVVIDADGHLFCNEDCLMDYYGCRCFDWDNEANEDYIQQD